MKEVDTAELGYVYMFMIWDNSDCWKPVRERT